MWNKANAKKNGLVQLDDHLKVPDQIGDTAGTRKQAYLSDPSFGIHIFGSIGWISGELTTFSLVESVYPKKYENIQQITNISHSKAFFFSKAGYVITHYRSNYHNNWSNHCF